MKTAPWSPRSPQAADQLAEVAPSLQSRTDSAAPPATSSSSSEPPLIEQMTQNYLEQASQAKYTSEELPGLFQAAQVRDGSGQPLVSEGGPTLAAAEGLAQVKEAAGDVAVSQVAETLAQGRVPFDTFVPLSPEGTRLVAESAVEHTLANVQHSNPAELAGAMGEAIQAREEFARDNSKLLATNSALGIAINTVDGPLTNGSSGDKLLAMAQLQGLSDALGRSETGSLPEVQSFQAATGSYRPAVGQLIVSAQNAATAQQMAGDSKVWLPENAQTRAQAADALDQNALDARSALPEAKELHAALSSTADAFREGSSDKVWAGAQAIFDGTNVEVDKLAPEVAKATREAAIESGKGLQDKSQKLEAIMDRGTEALSSEWRSMNEKELNLGEAIEPLKALKEQCDTPALRELLGDSAKGCTDAQLSSMVNAQDVEMAKTMGLTAQRVEDAASELREAAVLEGRGMDSVDNLVAMEALVAQERALQDMERNDPSFSRDEANVMRTDAQVQAEAENASREEASREQPERQKERELEMELDGGD